VRRLVPLAALAAAFAVAPTALGAVSPAEIRSADGTLVAGAHGTSFRFPANGYVARVAHVSTTAAQVELRGVSLLGGFVRASRVVVPARGLDGASVEGLTVGGRPLAAEPNTLVPLSGGSYVIVLQQAVAPGAQGHAIGLVGLRLFVAQAGYGVPAGSQVLLGLPGAARAVGVTGPPARRTTWSTLGLDAAPATVGLPSLPEPFAPTVASPVSVPMRGTTGEKAVALALQLLGIPYVWAGATPAGGFDCSGLTMYVYARLGIELSHFTGDQWYEGARIPAEQLQPGDLVFFHPKSYGPGHEGLYIGDGKFVHAPHTGDVVKISSLSEPGYALSYMGAVRPGV
jgi:cell wall-associated NlpC family hydrolase